MRRALAVGALVVIAASCERCDCEGPPVPAAGGEAPVTVTGAGRVPLTLALTTVRLERRGSGGELALGIAPAPGSAPGWLAGATLRLVLANLADPEPAVMLAGGRCALRYMHEGKLSEADFALGRAKALWRQRYGEQARLAVTVLCRKSVETTSSGRAHAAELPGEVELAVEVSGL